jgi:hypothetical protein
MLARTSIVAATALATVLALSSPAAPATLESPPVFANTGSSLTCLVANTGTAAREVTIEVIRFATDVAERVTTTLEPGESGRATHDDIRGLGRCRFVVAGSATGLRATACAIEGTHGCRGPVEAR